MNILVALKFVKIIYITGEMFMKQKIIFACLLMVILSACSSNGNTSNSTNDISTQSATSSKVEQANNSIGNDNHIFTPEIEQSIQ